MTHQAIAQSAIRSRRRLMARDYVVSGQAALPDDADRLAFAMLDALGSASAVVVDFEGVRAMSSAFSNALFLALDGTARRLDAIVAQIEFVGLSAYQQLVVDRSREAVIKSRPG